MTTVVRLNKPSGIIHAVPHLLGFVPQQSLVVIALRAQRLHFTMRFDLPTGPDMMTEAAKYAVKNALGQGADSIIAVVYSEDHREPLLIDDLQRVADEADLPIRDALHVMAGKWTSYLCTDPECCPEEGTPLVDDEESQTLTAAHALQGYNVLPTRDAMLAQLTPVDAVDVHEAERITAEQIWEILTPGHKITAGEAAATIVSLHHLGTRDGVLMRLANDSTEQIPALLSIFRQAPRDVLAPIATVAAAATYFSGQGMLARELVERALDDNEDYSLAQLLSTAMEHLVPPSALRKVLS